MAWLDLKAVLDRIRRRLSRDTDEPVHETPQRREPFHADYDQSAVDIPQAAVVSVPQAVIQEPPTLRSVAIPSLTIDVPAAPEAASLRRTVLTPTTVTQSEQDRVVGPHYAELKEWLAAPVATYSRYNVRGSGRFEVAVRRIEEQLETIAAAKRRAAYDRAGGPTINRLKPERIVRDLGVREAVRFGRSLEQSGILTKMVTSDFEREILEEVAARGWL